MTELTATTRAAATASTGGRLGDRLRLLRVAAGLTQTELAGERFSKEYVSQIERGKTRPTAETVEWLAGRLSVDPAFLRSGISTDERGRVEALLARAEALTQGYRYREAIETYEQARDAVAATNSVELDVR
ncbi:MAG TPA: helix-turn-helix transcriptional regulator, partial [Gaiellaceae bacterium]|nr:helix-turn-helix transcriptional regulator [Gaiellaceae bacterium]